MHHVRPDAHSLIADDDLELGRLDAQVDVHRPFHTLVSVDHDVVAGLAHGCVHVEQGSFPELEDVHDAAKRPADERDVLGFAGQDETKLGLSVRLRLRHQGQGPHSALGGEEMRVLSSPHYPTPARPKHLQSPPAAEDAAPARDLLGVTGRAVPGRSTASAVLRWADQERVESRFDLGHRL